MTEVITKQPITISFIFIWIGFICAISFMEAWIKFRAPGVTVPLGLGIGKLVFGALNKMEWLFTIIIILNSVLHKHFTFNTPSVLLLMVILILSLQTVWLLPALDARADAYIKGEGLPPSSLHFCFVGGELFKVTCLTIAAVLLFKHV